MNRKVLVIGASGHIGNAITRAFLQSGDTVTAVGRRFELPLNLRELRVRYICGDLESGGLETWVAGHEIVVDAAAPYPLSAFTVFPERNYSLASAERRTRRLIAAVQKHNATLVYVSSFVTRVNPRSAGQRVYKILSHLTHPYFETKQLIEAQLLEAGRRDLRVVVVNPAYCLGPWDLRDRAYCLLPRLFTGELPVVVDGKLSIVDVRDVADAVLAALSQSRFGEPFALEAHQITVAGLADMLDRDCAIDARPVPVPHTGLGAVLIDSLAAFVGVQSPVVSSASLAAGLFDSLDSSTAWAALKLHPRPLRETLRASMQWYSTLGYI